jgi:hypothetical protein
MRHGLSPRSTIYGRALRQCCPALASAGCSQPVKLHGRQSRTTPCMHCESGFATTPFIICQWPTFSLMILAFGHISWRSLRRRAEYGSDCMPIQRSQAVDDLNTAKVDIVSLAWKTRQPRHDRPMHVQRWIRASSLFRYQNLYNFPGHTFLSSFQPS